MSIRAALGLYLYLDHQDRQAKHEEWRERTINNINRWKDNVDTIEDIIEKSNNNVKSNTEKLSKANDFLNRMTSSKTTEWYEKTVNFINVCKNPSKAADAQSKIDEYDKKVSSCEDNITRLEEWIRTDKRKIYDLEEKVRSINNKISNCRSKL